MTLPELIDALSQMTIDAPHDISRVDIVDGRVSFLLTVTSPGMVRFNPDLVRFGPRLNDAATTYHGPGCGGGGSGYVSISGNGGNGGGK